MNDDYELDELDCPKCQHQLHYRHCQECDDGFIDEYDDDPINYAPGEELTRCRTCLGTGIQRWCPGCGTDFTDVDLE